MRLARRGVAAVVVAAGVLVVSGCGEPSPTVMESPRIVWQDGRAPDSPLEADPWVQAMRARDLGVSMAWNSGDFTIRQLTDYESDEDVARIVEYYVVQGDDPSVDVGPMPFEPLAVTELPDGSAAAVRACFLEKSMSEHATEPWIYDVFGEPERVATIGVWFWGFEEGTGERHRLDSDDPRIEEFDESVTDGEDEECDPESVPFGLYDPEPQLPEAPVTKPVRAPLVEVE